MAVRVHAALETALARATADAAQRRHRDVTLEHLLLALLQEEACLEVLGACGAEPSALGRELEEYLDLLPEVTRRSNAFDEPAQRTVQRAALHVITTGKEELTALDVLVAIPREGEAYAALALYAAGVTRLALTRRLSHGEAGAATTPETSHLRVRLHNDDYTTMDFVVKVLVSVFDRTEERATELMVTIHQTGSAIVATLPRLQALDCVEQVALLAEAAGHPLRCSLEPTGEALGRSP